MSETFGGFLMLFGYLVLILLAAIGIAAIFTVIDRGFRR